MTDEELVEIDDDGNVTPIDTANEPKKRAAFETVPPDRTGPKSIPNVVIVPVDLVERIVNHEATSNRVILKTDCQELRELWQDQILKPGGWTD
ncbi:MAG: hypothetical protein V3V37_08700 [Candidatus Adiutricales bacterium]